MFFAINSLLISAFSMEAIKAFFDKTISIGSIPIKMWALCIAALALIIFIILAAVLIASSGKNNQSDKKKSKTEKDAKPESKDSKLEQATAESAVNTQTDSTPAEVTAVTEEAVENSESNIRESQDTQTQISSPEEQVTEESDEIQAQSEEFAKDISEENEATQTEEQLPDIPENTEETEQAEEIATDILEEKDADKSVDDPCPVINTPDENVLDHQADAEEAAEYIAEAQTTEQDKNISLDEVPLDEVVDNDAKQKTDIESIPEEKIDTESEVKAPETSAETEDTTAVIEEEEVAEEEVAEEKKIEEEPTEDANFEAAPNIVIQEVEVASETVVDAEQPTEKESDDSSIISSESTVTDVAEAATIQDNEVKDELEDASEEADKKGAIGKYEIFLRMEGYCFSLTANNGQLLYDSFGFTTVEGAAKGIDTFKKTVTDGNFAVLEDKFGRFKFILNKRYQGQNYKSRLSCERSIKSVIRFANNSKIVITDPTQEELDLYTESIRNLKKASDIDWEAVAAEEAATPKLGTFEIYGDKNGYFVFFLIANNKQILYNSAPYASAVTARKAIDSFKRAVYIGNFFIDKDKFGTFRYIIRSSAAVTYVGESYSSELQARKSTESVKRFVKSATIIPYKKEETDTTAE